MHLFPEEIFFGLRKYAVIEEESSLALKTLTGFMLQETIINLCMLFEELTAFRNDNGTNSRKLQHRHP